MSDVSLEITLIILLVLANGVFSMAEMAIVSSRKTRLRQKAEAGGAGARVALELATAPNDFLSTVQVGITLVGTLAGAFGGATIAEQLAARLQQYPAIAPQSETVAISIVVLAISYVTLILGELVPKNVALANPERIASLVAPPMRLLSRIGAPAVRFLTLSTRIVMKLIPVRPPHEAHVTEEEIRVMIAEGAERGMFQQSEQEMVEGVFRLGDRRVIELMRPHGQVAFLDLAQPWERNLAVIQSTAFSRYPLLDGHPDRLVGVIHVKDLFLATNDGDTPDLRALAKPPLLVQETTPALKALDLFKTSGQQMALILDEHGAIQGLVTLSDLMEAVVGDFHEPGEPAKAALSRREDGTWLVDGALPIAELVEELEMPELSVAADGFFTVGGLILAGLRRIPRPGDHVVTGDWRFEVLDMDGNRVDKVLVSPLESRRP